MTREELIRRMEEATGISHSQINDREVSEVYNELKSHMLSVTSITPRDMRFTEEAIFGIVYGYLVGTCFPHSPDMLGLLQTIPELNIKLVQELAKILVEAIIEVYGPEALYLRPNPNVNTIHLN